MKKENLEQEIKQINIVYRNNSSFEKNIPVLEEILQQKDIKINKYIFPRHTPEEKITEWGNENKDLLKDYLLIADNTSIDALRNIDFNEAELSDYCYWFRSPEYSIESDIKLQKDNLDIIQRIKESVSLDDLFSDVMKKYIISDIQKYDNDEDYLLNRQEIYTKLFKIIPEQNKNDDTFIILTGISNKKYVKGGILISHEHGYKTESDIYDADRLTNLFAGMIKNSAQNAGISKIETYGWGKEIPKELMEKIIQGKAHIICNRHTPAGDDRDFNQFGEEFWQENKYLIKRNHFLQIPELNMFDDITKKFSGYDSNSLKKIIQEECEEQIFKKEYFVRDRIASIKELKIQKQAETEYQKEEEINTSFFKKIIKMIYKKI